MFAKHLNGKMLCKCKLFFRCKALFFFPERLHFLFALGFFFSLWQLCFCLHCKWLVACVCCCNMHPSHFACLYWDVSFSISKEFLKRCACKFHLTDVQITEMLSSLRGKKAGSCRRGVCLECACWPIALKPQLFEFTYCSWGSLLNQNHTDLTLTFSFLMVYP